MKRILLACLLVTAACSVTVQRAHAQTTVTVATFTAQVNLMDSFLVAGDVTDATTTWNTIHTMMMTELGTTKGQIASATTATDRATYTTLNQNQYTIYRQIWALKSALAANRVSIHTYLLNFAATI